MPPKSSSPSLARRIVKRVKKVFKSGDQTPASRAATPPPLAPPGDTPPPPASSLEPVPVPDPQPSTQAQQPEVFPQAELIPSEPAATTSPLATDGDQSANAESSLIQAATKAGADAWSGLKTALQVLEKSSSIPVLQSVLGEFLGVVDIFEAAARNRKDYKELASNLKGLVEEFKEHPGEYTSSKIAEALKTMASGLMEEMKHVEQQQQRSRVGGLLKVEQDMSDVQGCYRRIDTLCRELQSKVLVKIWRDQEEQQTDTRLKDLNAALNAMYDSSFSDVVGRRMCTAGTREAILAEMRQWADDPQAPEVFWLNGMAGTGKTTLAYSFCTEMQRSRRLGASFFCSRADAESRDVSRIVPTIAHQLARLLPLYREALIRRIGEDKDIMARKTETQFEKLIRDPLREVAASVPGGIIITIDALDECDRRDGARDILDVLFAHARNLPIKFFVTCRPEPGLFDKLQSQGERYRSVLHLHDIEASFVQADIKKYLEAELAEASLSPKKLRMLAEQAGVLFIYAATAVRYIHPKGRQVNAHKHLDNLLSMGSETGTKKHRGIDELYTAILCAPFADDDLEALEKENIRLVLDTAICAREPMNITTIAKLLELDDEDDVILALQHLRSVLHVFQGTSLVSTLHASFPDFMLDQTRSKSLWCNASIHNRRLALGCFSIMKCLLHFNRCKLESSFILDENIPNLAKRINDAVPSGLFYACRYWGDHLAIAEAPSDDHSVLDGFLSNRLLFWMEVLNLRKCIGAGAQMLNQAHLWLQKSGGTNDILELVLDAGRFVTAYGLSAASRSTPHIYVSALPFWPETRPIRARYWKRTRGLMRVKGEGVEGRDLSCLAMWNGGGGVTSVAHSPDGTRIVSGSDDKTIRVWDAHSGVLVAGPFQGHTESVTSVGFSPDGTRIVSSSNDNTIRVWDAHSGFLVAGPFQGHTDSVTSVGFSPNGTRIVSGSSDNTIRVWDAHSGLLVARPFQGHSGWVNCVCFSPDGTRIVSGSWDKTICVWDAHSGLLVASPFRRHTQSVRCVGFSPDGTRIVSSSNDNTIRVWDAHSGVLVAGPFQGHTESVTSVGFSPDGTRIVSGSRDKTIRVWDAHSGVLVPGPFQGHSAWVMSVGFSPDGTRIVSGSWDKTIRVWDAHRGLLVAGPFQGHTQPVTSVGFSPDGTRIVSGSYDNTIRVWDAHRGLLVAGPFRGHTNWVNAVGFSPDGTRIVSGSYDNTIRVWDAHSGLLVAGPFQGHTESVTSVGFSPDGTHIVSGSSDKTIRVWDAYRGLLVAGPFRGHTHSVTSVGFSPDGTHIVSGSGDNTIRVWDAHSGLLVAGPFRGHTRSVRSMGFSPDGTRIVSGSSDSTIHVWDAHSGLLVAGPFRGHTQSVTSVCFSPDGTRIVSGSDDNAIRVWTTTPLHVHDPGLFNDWLMDKIGMIATQQGQLLLCIPVDLRNGLVWPGNTVCIHGKGVFKPDFDGVLLGSEWTQCYV